MKSGQAAELNTQEAAELEATLSHILEGIQELRDRMSLDDESIARLKAETAELKVETRAVLATLRRAA